MRVRNESVGGRWRPAAVALVFGTMAMGCGDRARVPFERTVGSEPDLPPPRTSLVPTVEIAPAAGWPNGGTPTSPQGLVVQAFASELAHPRWL